MRRKILFFLLGTCYNHFFSPGFDYNGRFYFSALKCCSRIFFLTQLARGFFFNFPAQLVWYQNFNNEKTLQIEQHK